MATALVRSPKNSEECGAFMAEMGLSQNTAIEWWNGPHAIHGVGTFEFLRRHLQWPGLGQQEA